MIGGVGLPETLRAWTDYDIAMFEVARALGIFAEDVTLGSARGLFFMETPVSTAMGQTMDALVVLGVPEYREAEYRWAPQEGIPGSAG
jgi:hypothetical protein